MDVPRVRRKWMEAVMANTPTLDEIEAMARAHAATATLPGGYVQMDVERVSVALLGLVAHVRALDKRVSGAEGYRDEVDAFVLCDRARITALEAKAAALSAADDVGRAAARAESATSPRMAQKAWAPVAEELDRLRAENAAQSKALEEALLLGKDALFAAQAREQKLAEENAELRKRIAELEEWWRCNLCFGSGFYVANSGAGKVECPYCGPSVSREKPTAAKPWPAPAWPAPHPIETAPLGRTVFWYSIAFKEWRCFAVTAEDMDEVRAGYSHWIPMPPPPGGGK